MKRLLLLSWLILAGPGLSRADTVATYVIGGAVGPVAPNIDATNVINNSTNFNIFTTLPFDTSNTRNFTNNGTMNGSVGFQFDNAPSTGPRQLSDHFVNQVNGIVTAEDGYVFDPNFYYTVSYLWVHATNIINKGQLIAESAGEVQITGTNVNLARSGVGINPILPRGSFYVATNLFQPDDGIFDLYWAQTNMNFDSSRITRFDAVGNLVSVTAPLHNVTFPGGFNGVSGFTITSGIYGAYTNAVPPPVTITVTNSAGGQRDVTFYTNLIRQAVFVGFTESNLQVTIHFSPSSSPTNYMQTASVEMLVPETNSITAQPFFRSLYFVDTLASETNRGVWTNITTIPGTASPTPTFRPANYLVSRLEPPEFFGGSPGNALVDTNFIYQYKPPFTNRFVSSEYAAYSASVDFLNSRPPDVPGADPTNYPGRLTINADSLDLTKTRMRAEGLLTLNAHHLVGSSNAIPDSAILDYDLGSTNGTLVLQDLMRESVERFNGTIYAWSAVWSNSYDFVVTNYIPDPSDDTKFIRSDITNTITVNLHTLILDADALVNLVPVSVFELALHSTNVVIRDNGVVSRDFLIDGQSFTLEGRLTLAGTVQNWTTAVAPSLRYFTNTGTLNVVNEAHFGDDAPTNYLAFVNRGTIQSQEQVINSDYCELNGTNLSGAAFTVLARDIKVEAGQISSAAGISFTANTLKFNASDVAAGGRLYLTVTNALFDNGGASGNTISCGDGFEMTLKPAVGDLLGTAFTSFCPTFGEVDHIWAGEDRGASTLGYTNNVSLGSLTPWPEGVDPFFVFSGATVSNGLYVDLLDLSALDDYANELAIDPNLVIYYAAAKLSFTPPLTNGVLPEPEEYLNGQFGGRLQWVSSFAGPNSSVAVVSNGVSIMVNRALRYSLIIDSNNNGIPNGLDPHPFDTMIMASLAVTNMPPLTVSLSWNAVAQKVYQIQATTNFLSANWQTVLYYTNTATANGTATVNVPVSPGATRQFYRVGTALQ